MDKQVRTALFFMFRFGLLIACIKRFIIRPKHCQQILEVIKMKNHRSLIAVVLAVTLIATMCAALTGCSSNKNKVYTIGICQLIQHEALDAATEGFKKAVIDGLGEENVVFDPQNAQGEATVCSTIVNSFVTKKVDLIMANGTAALQAAYNATQTIPILGTSITEYGVALNIDNFSGTVGGNVSGASDLAPLSEQADMILELFPDAKKVAYSTAQPSPTRNIRLRSFPNTSVRRVSHALATHSATRTMSLRSQQRRPQTATLSTSRQTTQPLTASRLSATSSPLRKSPLSQAKQVSARAAA